jgi:hypothetical protein
MPLMAKKHYPVVRSANIANTSGVPQNDRVLLVDRLLSVTNRRLYRMGRYYQVKIDLDINQSTDIEVFALRDDWAVQKAFQMAYNEYLDNTADERANLSSNQIARWEDFRVKHGITGADIVVPVLYNGGGVSVPLTGGSFADSNVVDSSNARRTFTWSTTPGATEYGLLAEFDKAGNAQTTPTSKTNDGAYIELDSEVNDLTMDDLQYDGADPPYDATGVNGASPWVKIADLGTGASGVQRLSTGFFTAPCGIVVLRGVGAADNDAGIIWTVKSGDYKGVSAPSMLE